MSQDWRAAHSPFDNRQTEERRTMSGSSRQISAMNWVWCLLALLTLMPCKVYPVCSVTVARRWNRWSKNYGRTLRISTVRPRSYEK